LIQNILVAGALTASTVAARAEPAAKAQSLRDLAKLHPPPAKLSEATLIIIDAQGEYRSGPLALDRMDAALHQLSNLLGRARAAKTPIIHIAQIGDPGDLFDRSSPGGQFLPEVTPREGEIVIEKPLPNSFARTELQQRLTAIGRKDLLIVGFMTHMCVSSTVRAAFDLDYQVTVASDATATRALPSASGGKAIAAAAVQAAGLAAMADYFATVVPCAAIVS
jgi:nicotinamidase-related amidase